MKSDIKDLLSILTRNYGTFKFEEKPFSEFKSEFPVVFHPVQLKQCFSNSFQIIIEKMMDKDAFAKYKYAVGFLLMPDMVIPIEHAVIRKGDQYYDPTLNRMDFQFVPIYELGLQDMLKLYDIPDMSAPQIYDIHRLCERGILKFEEVAIK